MHAQTRLRIASRWELVATIKRPILEVITNISYVKGIYMKELYAVLTVIRRDTQKDDQEGDADRDPGRKDMETIAGRHRKGWLQLTVSNLLLYRKTGNRK